MPQGRGYERERVCSGCGFVFATQEVVKPEKVTDLLPEGLRIAADLYAGLRNPDSRETALLMLRGLAAYERDPQKVTGSRRGRKPNNVHQ